MAMKYRFQSAYRIIGLIPPAQPSEEVLLENLATKERAVLAYELDDHLFELDRASAVGRLLLKNVIGQGEGETFENSLKNELGEMRTQRNREIEREVFVVFEAEGEVDSWSPRNHREQAEFVIALGGPSKQPLRARHQPTINGVLASFALGSDRVSGFQRLAEDVYFINEEGKPVYAYDLNVSATGTVLSPLGTEVVDYVKHNARTIAAHEELAIPARLLARSLDQESDALLSFLSAWTGLEIFVNKTFLACRSGAIEDYAPSEEPASYSPRPDEEDKADAPPLGTKFSHLLSLLAPECRTDDVREFQRVKRRRNSLVHEGDVGEAPWPTDRTRALLRKYLTLRIAELQRA